MFLYILCIIVTGFAKGASRKLVLFGEKVGNLLDDVDIFMPTHTQTTPTSLAQIAQLGKH